MRYASSTSRLAQALFAPKTIALVGASGDATKNTARPQRLLKKHHYGGRIIPINPGRSEIFGDRAYPDLASVPETIDHAFIMVPAHSVAGALEQCVGKKVPVATVFSDGFAETGMEGRRKQQRLLDIAREGGVRLLGPSCMGLISVEPKCVLTVNAVMEFAELKPGPLAVISQSGSMIGALLSRGVGRGVGFSKLVAVGNEADLSVGEIADLLVDDPHTEAILLFMEAIRDAENLARAARRAYAVGKPMIVYKLGRSAIGRDLAASHTGAMAGDKEIAEMFFRANGMLQVDILETLFELPALVTKQKPSTRKSVAAMTTTGGGAASVVDVLGTFGVDIAPPTESVISNLAAQGIRITQTPLTDLTVTGAKRGIYLPVLNELLASDHCDLVLAVVGSSAQYQPEVLIEPIIDSSRGGKPLAVFLAPHAEASLARLSEAGIAGFRMPECCADAIRAWHDWTAPLESPPLDLQRLARVRDMLNDAPRINEEYACRVFAVLGIPQAPHTVISAPDGAIDIEFPVVAKILSSDIAHKSDAGGVILNVTSQALLRSAVARIFENVHIKHPGAKIDGILVQRMEIGLAEVIVGFKRDPQVGAVVVLGIGGLLAEIYRDFAVRPAPVSVEQAMQMIGEVKGLALLSGYRGAPKGDVAALAAAVSAFSQLAGIEEITEAEVNPLMVKAVGGGVVALDGLLVRASAKTTGKWTS